MSKNSIYDDEQDSGFRFTSSYDFEKIKPRVIKHFERGLLYRTLPGACGVSKRTIERWIKDKPEFRELVETAKQLGKLVVDKQHLSVAKDGSGNGQCMKQRAECELDLIPHSEKLEEIQQVAKELADARTKLAEKQAKLDERERILNEQIEKYDKLNLS